MKRILYKCIKIIEKKKFKKNTNYFVITNFFVSLPYN